MDDNVAVSRKAPSNAFSVVAENFDTLHLARKRMSNTSVEVDDVLMNLLLGFEAMFLGT